MMGCLPGRRTLWAGLAAAVLAGASGCVEDESLFLLHPEGPPEVVAAFVFVPVGAEPDYEVREVYADLLAGSGLTFGSHPDVNNGEDVTTPVSNVLLNSQVQVVFDELIRGQSMEQFKCACWNPSATGVLAADGTACPAPGAGVRYSDSADVAACTGCPEDPATDTIELDRCEDVNLDEVPDDSVLKVGLASVTCDTGSFTFTSNEGSGRYQPSGSLVLSAFQPIRSLGPSFLFNLPAGMTYPSDSTCTFVVNANNTIVDKDGNALAQTSFTFNTTPTRVTGVTYPDGTKDALGDDESGEFVLTFNEPIDVSDANLARVTMTCTGGTGGSAPVQLDLDEEEADRDPLHVTFVAEDGFGFAKTCTVTVAAGFVDEWGNAVVLGLSEDNDRSLSFQTEEEPADSGKR